MSWFNFLTSIGKETEANAFEELILTEGTVFNFIYQHLHNCYIKQINITGMPLIGILFLCKGIFVQ